MTHQEVIEMIEKIKDAGYVVIAFSPDELGEETNPNHLEQILIERGWHYIDSQNS